MGHFRYYMAPLAVVGTSFIAGCVNVYPPQFPENHPANANAPQTPLVIQSQIEPYRSAEAASAGERAGMAGSGGMQGMDHGVPPLPGATGQAPRPHAGKQGMDHSQHAQADSSGTSTEKDRARAGQDMDHAGAHGSSAGRPESVSEATRTIQVAALDTMRFDPQSIRVNAGETIRFIVTNKGKLPHEFVIGTPQEQKQHAAMMQKAPGMKHEDENAIHLAPGETEILIWRFGQAGTVEIGCHEPGHYPAGMVGKVIVSPDSGPTSKQTRPQASGEASGSGHSQHQHGK